MKTTPTAHKEAFAELRAKETAAPMTEDEYEALWFKQATEEKPRTTPRLRTIEEIRAGWEAIRKDPAFVEHDRVFGPARSHP